MRLLAGLIIATVLVALFHRAIRCVPWLFYVLAIALDALLIVGSSYQMPSWFREYFMFMLQSNNLAMGLFTMVMFAGVLEDHSKIKKALLLVRAEISIIASVLCVGHIVIYAQSYLSQAMNSIASMPLMRVCAILVALVLVFLLVPLVVTSFKPVRAHMSQQGWKRLQRLAYPFYGLVFVHILFFLLPPALAGSLSATVNVVLYLVLGLTYLVLRLRFHRKTQYLADFAPTAEP